MTVAAQKIIRDATVALQDPAAVRWTVPELVGYLNDGQDELVIHRPDATATHASVELVAGARQSLPAAAAKLIQILRNTGGRKRAIRWCDRALLDAVSPGWEGLPGVTEVVHSMFDPRDPRSYYVYPPAGASGASVDMVYAAHPAPVAVPADGSAVTAVTGNISVPDIFEGALLDYVLFRAYSKDAEHAVNGARAQAHYAAFAGALGVEVKGSAAVAPAPVGSVAGRVL